jgi:hypothetical protein
VQLRYDGKKQCQEADEAQYMAGELLTVNAEGTHIGVVQSPDATNEKRARSNIAAARATVYSMFGAGLHGENGLNPRYSIHLWNTIALPCLLNGTEVWRLNPRETEPLEVFQRSVLRQLQGLPDSAANAAVYLLSGVLPVTARIHMRVLTYFRSVVADRTSREYKLALQQLALKEEGSHSWFTYVEDILHQYQLPNPHDILASTPAKEGWKLLVKKTIFLHWRKEIEAEAAQKSSLRHLHQEMEPGRVALVWESAGNSVTDSAKAQIKARLMTGTYRLQSLVARQNQNAPDGTCKLCQTADEDVGHFLLDCPSTDSGRGAESYRGEREVLIQAILDCRGLVSGGQVSDSNQTRVAFLVERLSRDLVGLLHRSRWSQLQRLARSTSTCADTNT